MKLPQTSEDVKTEILISSDKAGEVGDLRIRQLIKILDKVDHEIIVDGVINVFETNRPDSLYQDHEFAGRVLMTINPKSKTDLKEILKRTLMTWDKSVEQLPLWFRDNYGLEKVRDTFDNLELTDKERENGDNEILVAVKSSQRLTKSYKSWRHSDDYLLFQRCAATPYSKTL